MFADDNSPSLDNLSDVMRSYGYQVILVDSVQKLLRLAKENQNIDLFLINTNLTGFSIMETIVALRETNKAPLILLTENLQEEYIETAYENGADEVFTIPYSEKALLIRIKSLLRRYLIYRGKVSDFQGVCIDEDQHTVTKNGQTVAMTGMEMSILEFMLAQSGKVLSIQQIYEGVWGEKYLPQSSNTVMVHILNIRKKLEDNISHPTLIRTVWGKGYKLAGISHSRAASS